ncbi:MAG: hypothetical protein KJ971_07680 [Firmicutes bacterium]|nr:hypothetical protein [Bacillota bacterium]
MTIWWEGLTVFQQVMFVIAVPATVIMIIFMILMLLGISDTEFDGSVDIDGGDIDGSMDSFNDEPLSGFSGLKVLTLRGVLAFLSIGAWVSFIASNYLIPILSLLIGMACGALAAYLLALAFKAAMNLESEGNLNYENAIGKNGTVYIRVPNNKTGKGKVTLTFQERFVEVEAVTLEQIDLMPGTSVEITGLENETTVVVKKI